MPSIELLPPGVTPESTLLAPDGVPRPEAHAGAAEAGLDLVPYRLWAVVNPGAGTAEPAMAVAKLKERYGDFTLFEPRSGADFDAFAERLESELRQGDGPDCVVAAGGDGTVSGVASALWRTKKKLSSEEEAVPGRMAPRLAILPMGTANVLARELGITGTLDESCELIRGGRSRALDVIEYEDRALLCRFVLGDLARPGSRTSSAEKQRLGPVAYGLNALSELVEPQVRRYELEIDGERIQCEASSLVLTNLARTGLGELCWGSSISPHDGELNLIVIRSEGLLDNLSKLWSSVLEALEGEPGIEHHIVRERLVIRGSEGVAAVADGEEVSAASHRFELRPTALEVMVPHEILGLDPS